MALLSWPFKSPTFSSLYLLNHTLVPTINPKLDLPISPKLRKISISTTPSFSPFRSSSQKKTLCFVYSSSESSPEIDHNTPPPTILFVKGLAKSVSERSLKTTFSLFGDVSRVKVIIDKKTGQSLGFAYIWFSSIEVAHRAVEKMNGKFFEGRFINVSIAKPGSCKTQAKAAPYKF